jgi:hypothetical protein
LRGGEAAVAREIEMTWTRQGISITGAFALALTAIAAPAASRAQPSPAISDVQKVSETATVQSVDPATRHLVIKRPSGETASIKVPAEVRNFENLKPGDAIRATYYRETEITISKGSEPLPEDTATVFTARAPQGGLPGGVIANRLVVSGAVVGIDKARNLVKVVSPQGGEVHEMEVRDPRGRELLGELKVGDKITASVSESLLIAATRE